MVEAQGPGGTLEFKYDALGRRIEKKSADRTIRYVWCGELLTREIIETPDGESIRDYLYHPGSYEPLALRVDGNYYYYHNDHQGTPQRLTDAQGAVVWAADYFAFGHARVRVGVVENPLRFLGQYADVETGLHYNRFRYFSPALGRYLSVDPVSLLGGPNLYAYAENDPINRSDPLGLFSWGAVAAAVGAGAAALAVAVLAPVAVPIMLAVVGGAALGVALGIGIAEVSSIHSFCLECFMKGAEKAFPTAFGIGFGIAAIGALCPPLGVALAVGAAVYGTYALLDHHFGWSSGKPFDQMTEDEKSESVGELVGGTVGGILGGLIGGAFGGGVAEGLGEGPVEGPAEVGEVGEEELSKKAPKVSRSKRRQLAKKMSARRRLAKTTLAKRSLPKRNPEKKSSPSRKRAAPSQPESRRKPRSTPRPSSTPTTPRCRTRSTSATTPSRSETKHARAAMKTPPILPKSARITRPNASVS
jgi:RHS repeat-associated protein